jgi:two-component system nitrogen regulation response regulator GlnG
VMASGREIHVGDLPPELRRGEAEVLTTTNWESALRNWADQELGRRPEVDGSPLLDVAVPKFERIMIDVALKHTGGRRRDASNLLGWGRNTLTRKIKELGMEAENPESDAPGDDAEDG